MADKTNEGQRMDSINKKLEDIDNHLKMMSESMQDLNGAVDMLVRFSMTVKAFMELSISQGIIDPYELKRIASQYEKSYSSNLGNINESTEYSLKNTKFNT